MNKKNYQKPVMQVVRIQNASFICQSQGSPQVNSVGGNVFSNTAPTAGNGDARSRSFDDWDDEE